MTQKTIKENIKGNIFLSSYFIVLFISGRILKNLHNHGMWKFLKNLKKIKFLIQ
jgi:hypothetical protein